MSAFFDRVMVLVCLLDCAASMWVHNPSAAAGWAVAMIAYLLKLAEAPS